MAQIEISSTENSPARKLLGDSKSVPIEHQLAKPTKPVAGESVTRPRTTNRIDPTGRQILQRGTTLPTEQPSFATRHNRKAPNSPRSRTKNTTNLFQEKERKKNSSSNSQRSTRANRRKRPTGSATFFLCPCCILPAADLPATEEAGNFAEEGKGGVARKAGPLSPPPRSSKKGAGGK